MASGIAREKMSSIDELYNNFWKVRIPQIAQLKLDQYASCSCCEEHQKNKPKKYLPLVDTPTLNNKKKPCSCDCRHNARLICRFHNDYVHHPDACGRRDECGATVLSILTDVSSWEQQTFVECDMPLSDYRVDSRL